MKLSVNQPCPCGSHQKYKKCCKVFHNGAWPSNALQLMKSRYSAFVAHQYAYIIKTTHPSNQDYTPNIDMWKEDIAQFCHQSSFKKLEILEFLDGQNEAYVTFKATIYQGDHDSSFVEKSKFLKVQNHWLYHSGVFLDV